MNLSFSRSLPNGFLLPRRFPAAVISLALGLGAFSGAQAAVPTLANGGFESGLAGWTVVDQLGSDGTFFAHSGSLSPVNGLPVAAPPAGTQAAMTDAAAGGSHVMYQDFLVTSADAATLSFSLYINNGAGDFYTPATLDWATPELNQQARVDIISTSADVFSMAPADILFTAYATQVGDPAVSGYTTVTSNVSSLLANHMGQTLRLRFAEADNVFTFQMGVDSVAFAPAVPEPTTTLLLALGLGAVGWAGARARRGAGPN